MYSRAYVFSEPHEGLTFPKGHLLRSPHLTGEDCCAASLPVRNSFYVGIRKPLKSDILWVAIRKIWFSEWSLAFLFDHAKSVGVKSYTQQHKFFSEAHRVLTFLWFRFFVLRYDWLIFYSVKVNVRGTLKGRKSVSGNERPRQWTRGSEKAIPILRDGDDLR